MAGIDLKKLVKALKADNLIVTPRLNQFLIQHGDEPYPEWVVDVLADLMKGKPRVRTGTFSASSSGTCPRRQLLQFLGVPTVGAIDPQLQNIFNDGKMRHLRWQGMLLSAGILDAVESPLKWKQMNAWATPDGKGIVPDDHPRPGWRGKTFGFELKGVSPFQYADFANDKPKDEHLKQVARCALMGGYDLYVVIYENKATQAWCEWVYQITDEEMDESEDELVTLNHHNTMKQLPPMLGACKRHVGKEWEECPFGGAQGPCVKAGKWPRLQGNP